MCVASAKAGRACSLCEALEPEELEGLVSARGRKAALKTELRSSMVVWEKWIGGSVEAAELLLLGSGECGRFVEDMVFAVVKTR